MEDVNSENQFIKVMKKHSNEKLVYILTTDQEGFQPLALEAAKIVLDQRDLTDNEKTLLEEKILNKELDQKKANKVNPGPQSLFKGPGLIVTIIVLVPLMLIIENRTWLVTMGLAVIGFGAGHIVNYFYFKNKKRKNNPDILD